MRKERGILLSNCMAFFFYLDTDTGEVDWNGLEGTNSLFKNTLQNVRTPEDFKRTYPDLMSTTFWQEFVKEWEDSIARLQKNLMSLVKE